MGGQEDHEPTTNYSVQSVEGWSVYVNKRLLNEDKALGRMVLDCLRVKLYDINRIVPKAALDALHEIPIWLEAASKDVVCACYHPSRGWLEAHGFNPEKARCVEIGNPRNFLKWTLHQPSMVLHELAHGYHHRVLEYGNPDIRKAFDAARKSGRYDSVLYYNGRKDRAYAMNNDQEYFAELTEAFFGTNDMYPFVRAEIMIHDPLMYETLEKVWGEKEAEAKTRGR
jgi:hypothetical protein